MSPFTDLLDRRLRSHRRLRFNPVRSVLIEDILRYREALETRTGALAVWHRSGCTGRIPRDTYVVRHEEDEGLDWTQANNNPMTPETFDDLFRDALDTLRIRGRLYITDRCVGADPRYTLPARTVTNRALTALFTDTLFRPLPENLEESVFADRGFTLLVLPYDHIDTRKYEGVLRSENGRTVDMAIAMDMRRRLGIVYGTSYCGAVKKLAFTVMNHLLPPEGVLPLHCSATEDARGDVHLFLGLSGTGKTTLSADPNRSLIGDDEHLWTRDGVANMENGCYAKLIHLSPRKEPDIHAAVFARKPVAENGVIIENALVFPDGDIDLDDARLTENSRAVYRLSALRKAKNSAQAGQPRTVVFLTADASGVLPPVARLPMSQAMLWFFLGYTSKLAGTEAGVQSPVPTFSRFFGGPFMTRGSADYLSLFGERVRESGADVYLINTGWTGGPVGVGKRMDIDVTRAIVDAALSGALKDVTYREDPLFHLLIPKTCPGVDPALLDPASTWADPAKHAEAAQKLASLFAAHYLKHQADPALEALRGVCPGL